MSFVTGSQSQQKLKSEMSGGDDGQSGEVEELEAKRRDDSSWHPCRISVSPDYLGDHFIVRFQSCGMEDVLLHKEEVLTQLRLRSIPLRGDDCSSINGGETILAAPNSEGDMTFYDAEVERVRRVRHSKRCCRCSFVIKWLDRDIQAGTLIVPSISIRKLASNSITIHPMIAAFLNPQKDGDLCLSDASPLSGVIKDSDSEFGLDAFLQKQIEQINNMVDAYINDSPGVKLAGLKQQSPISASGLSSSLVPGDCNELKSETRASRKTEVNVHEHPLETKVFESVEKLTGDRVHLSPLASRAALALSLLNTKRCLVMDFNCCIDVPTEKVPLEGVAIPVKPVSKPIQIVVGLMSTNSVGSEKPQQTENLPSLSNKSMNTGNTLPQESTLHDAENGAPDSEQETAENATSTLDNSALVTSGAKTKPSGLRNSYASSAKQVRFTRSALQNSSRMLNDAQMKIDNDKEERVLRNKRKLASSSTLGDKENLATEISTKLEQISSLEPSKSIGAISVNKVSTPVKKRKEISSELHAEIHINKEGRNRNQMADVAETPRLFQGKDTGCHQIDQGHKRKAINSSKNQYGRVTPWIDLPRTRSQTKSREHQKH